jgi:hypothetical protein
MGELALRALGKVCFRGSFVILSFFSSSLPFFLVCRFSCLLLDLWFFLLLDELF